MSERRGDLRRAAALRGPCPCAASCPSPPSRSRSSPPPRPRPTRPSPRSAAQSPVAGYGGWQAWSRYDERHRPLHAHGARPPGQPAAPPRLPDLVAAVRRLAGPRRRQERRRVYQRCGSSGCDIRRYNTRQRPDAKLSTVSSPSYGEATPAIWGANVVFTRRVHGCDVPYVKDLELLGAQPAAAQEQVPADRPRPRLDPRHAASSSARSTRAAPTATAPASRSPSCASTRAAPAARRSSSGRASARSPTSSARWPRTIASPTPCASGSTRPTRSCAIPCSGGKPEEVRAFRTLTDAFAKPTRQLVALRRVPGRRGDARATASPTSRAASCSRPRSRSAACSAR